MWKGIFQFRDKVYFAQHNHIKVVISDGLKCVREYSRESVSGCAYNGKILWLSIENSNTIIAVDPQNNEELIPLWEYDNIRIVKMVTGQESVLVLEGCSADDKSLFIFDCKTEMILFVLPIKERFVDVALTSYKTALLLCNENRCVPRRYSDDLDDTEVLFWAELEWNQDSTEVTIKRSIKLYIDHNHATASGHDIQTINYSEGLCFPLFDLYLYHWLEQKSFSLNGKYVVYYSEDIRGIIVGNPVGGKIHRIIAIPDDVADSENDFFYNYHTNELLVITKENKIIRYVINCASEAAIDSLNVAYNKAFLNKISLYEKRNKGDLTFTSILFRAISSCVCMPTGVICAGNKSDKGITKVKLTIKTPISGKIILKQTQKVLTYFKCEEEEFEKTIEFDVSEDVFGVVFKTECLEKEFFFNVYTYEGLHIDVADCLTFNEIAQCCNRNNARRRLQQYPTDMYATYQLGYVGTEEDYNFLLSVLEDDYCGSSLCHGNNGERVWMCVRAICNLSYRYRRKDAIPFLIEVCKHIENKKVLEMVRDCCTSLKTQKCYSEKRYRVDLLVRTHSIVDVYIDSQEVLIAKINGTLEPDERIDWCYLRSSSKKIKVIFEMPSGKKEAIIDIGDNDLTYRQIIDIETPIFSCEMAKTILENHGDRVLVVPEKVNRKGDILGNVGHGFFIPQYGVALPQEIIKGEKGMKFRVPHFKIGITFSGKYRKQYIEPLCEELLKLGYDRNDIFYDSWHEVLINGVHGDSILRQIYFESCDCVVVLLSPDYKEKNWTGHIEWSAVRELINTGFDDKICLLRVDSADIGEIEGLYQNQAIAKAIDDMSVAEIASFVHQKYMMLI